MWLCELGSYGGLQCGSEMSGTTGKIVDRALQGQLDGSVNWIHTHRTVQAFWRSGLEDL